MRAALVMSSAVGSRIAFACFVQRSASARTACSSAPEINASKSLSLTATTSAPNRFLDFVGRLGGRGAASGREQQNPRLLHHGDHPEQAKGALEFVIVAGGEEGDAMPWRCQRWAYIQS
jgi:hypothetical protein